MTGSMRLPFQLSGPSIRLSMITCATLALFSCGVYSHPGSRSPRSPPQGGSLSEPNNISAAPIRDEFSGLTLLCDKQRTGPNRFTTESIAIASVTAMKEEALKDYNAPLHDFDFTNTLPPNVPIRIVVRAAEGAPPRMLTRSSVMWTIRALSVELMRTRFLHPLLFAVKYYFDFLYGGVLVQPNEPTPPPELVTSHLSLSLAPSSGNATSKPRGNPKVLGDETHYEVNFDFVGESLAQFRIFESLMTTILQLAPSDAVSVQPQVAMDDAEFPVWVFMRQVPHPAGYEFQQYHAVALLEAAARYYVLHQRFTEMKFEILMDGHLSASGCVTKALYARKWCRFGLEGDQTETGELIASA